MGDVERHLKEIFNDLLSTQASKRGAAAEVLPRYSKPEGWNLKSQALC